MNYDEREKWLQNLQVGDEVTYHQRFHGNIITTIERITPKRQIKTADGMVFRNGHCRVTSWESYSIYPVTDRIRQDIEKKQLIYYLDKALNLNQLSIDQLKSIKLILEGNPHGRKSESSKQSNPVEQPKEASDKG